jgi:hypothetical protein
MTESAAFTLTVDQNMHVPPGTAEMAAVLTVTCESTGTSKSEVAEVIVIDRSGSMLGRKLEEAKKAAQSAVDALPDGAYFAVVLGESNAQVIHPRKGLARATDRERFQAKRAIETTAVRGGTDIGSWLRSAADVLETRPSALGHVLVLTDGQGALSEHDLAYCDGKLGCTAVGIGTDWDPDQLKLLADRYKGRRDFIEDLADLGSYFAAVVKEATSKALGDVELRFRPSIGASVESVRQMYPILSDLTPHRTEVDAKTIGIRLAPWGVESREYMVDLTAPVGEPGGRELRIARVELVRTESGEVLARENVFIRWTDDPNLNTEVNPKVAVHTGQQQLAEEVRSGLAALRAHDPLTATQHLATARALAEEAGNERTAKLLDRILDFDPGTGTAKLKGGITAADKFQIEVGTDVTRAATSRDAGSDR